MTQRFRQELPLHPNPVAALQTAASGTGSALAGSAASSIVGFAVMGFAPMPLFSTYGIISAVMVLMAGSASLLALPPCFCWWRERGEEGVGSVVKLARHP